MGLILGACLVFLILFSKTVFPFFPSVPCAFKDLTGLPCPFCGGTRAACAALQGDFSHSLRLNALSMPFLALLVSITVTSVVEILCGRPLARWQDIFRWLAKSWPYWLALLFLWWTLHIFFALQDSQSVLVDLKAPLVIHLRAWMNLMNR
ncbi:MAG: DUF2752 domain-containing protein [bacterium]